jgi:DNA polymerase-3 subunit beta
MNRLEIKKSDIASVLKRVICGIGKGNTLPILNNVNIVLTGAELNLTATDLEIQASASTQCVPMDGDCSFTINADNLNKIVSQLSDDNIEFVQNDDKVTIKSGKSRFNLNSLPSQDYPSIGLDINPLITFDIESSILLKALKHTAFAVAKNDARYYLNGLLFDLSPNFSGLGSDKRMRDDKQRLRLVGTDGHRMAISEFFVNCTGENQFVIPKRCALELVKLLDDNDETIKVELATDYARFTLPSMVLTTKTIMGKFPEYQRVVPKNSDKSALINRDALKSALQRLSILSHERYKGIKLLFEPGSETGTLNLEVNNEDSEQGTDSLDVDFTDTEGAIAFNIQYVLDVLSAVNCNMVCIEFTDAISSALFRDPDVTNEVFVVMPMRL